MLNKVKRNHITVQPVLGNSANVNKNKNDVIITVYSAVCSVLAGGYHSAGTYKCLASTKLIGKEVNTHKSPEGKFGSHNSNGIKGKRRI